MPLIPHLKYSYQSDFSYEMEKPSTLKRPGLTNEDKQIFLQIISLRYLTEKSAQYCLFVLHYHRLVQKQTQYLDQLPSAIQNNHNNQYVHLKDKHNTCFENLIIRICQKILPIRFTRPGARQRNFG